MAEVKRMAMAMVVALCALPGLAPGIAHAAGFDVEHATQAWLATLSGPARARSDAYFEGRVWLSLWSPMFAVGICWLLLRMRLLPKVRDGMQRRGWRPWLAILACALVFLLADQVLSLPWSFYADFLREKEYGLMNQSLGAWLGDQAIAFVLSAVFGSAVLLIVYAVIRKYPERWWLICTGVAACGFILVVMIAPVVLFPLFNTSTELPAGPVRDRIVSLAQANHLKADHVYLVDESRQSDRISAYVAGIGPTFRITLNDNLLRKTSVEETVAVTAHELGHYIHGHLWKQTAALSLIWGLLLWLSSRIAPSLIRYGGQRWGVQNLGDPASLPVLAGVLAVLSLLATPIFNTLIRVQESQADAFGLDAAREPDAWASAAMKLSPYRKVAPGPLEEMLFFDHPSGATRVRMAMQWKKDHVPGAQEVVPPPLPAVKP